MGPDLTSAAAGALALGAVLATMAVALSVLRAGERPGLAIGAVAGIGAALGARLVPALALPLVAVALVVVGGAAGVVLAGLRSTVALGRGQGGGSGSEAVGELAGLGLGVAVAAALGSGVALPLAAAQGPLGAVPTLTGALAMLLLSGAAVIVLARWRGDGLPVGLPVALVAGGALALVAGLGHFATMGALPFTTPVDTAGLAVRGFAAALAGRDDPVDAAAAGLGLAFAEALVRQVDPSGAWALLPTLLLLVLALGGDARARRRTAREHVLARWRRAVRP